MNEDQLEIRCLKRLRNEIQHLQANPPEDCSVPILLFEDDLRTWSVTIMSTNFDGTPYENGRFDVIISFPIDYPVVPPTMTFQTPIYHPNVRKDGAIQLEDLELAQWSPIISVNKLLLSLLCRMREPDLERDDPIAPDIADIARNNKKLYFDTAREWTEKYAC